MVWTRLGSRGPPIASLRLCWPILSGEREERGLLRAMNVNTTTLVLDAHTVPSTDIRHQLHLVTCHQLMISPLLQKALLVSCTCNL